MATMLAPLQRRRKGNLRRFLSFKHDTTTQGVAETLDGFQTTNTASSSAKFDGVQVVANNPVPNQLPSQYTKAELSSRQNPNVPQNEPSHELKDTIDPNNPIWKDYVKEAVDEDQDMLNAWNDDLDTLLVFSGLFSAILTAFLIESSGGLKPDPSSAIVSAIQEGFRVSNNLTTSSFAPAAENEPFKADPRDVRVNALWFASLSLSLSSAAAAMLAKTWLVAYSRQLSLGSAYQRAERRQKRFDGLRRWRFQGAMDILPFPVFISIILFGTGLCDFLYGLHTLIAAISTTVFSIGVFSLVVVNSLRLFIPECPYHIPFPITMPAAPLVIESLQNLLSLISRFLRYTFYDLLVVSWNSVHWPSTQTWTGIPRVLFTAVFITAPSLVYGRASLWWKFARKRLNHLYKAMQDIKHSDQTWKATALAWLIESSSEEEVITRALHLIPAGSRGLTDSNPLCKREILDILLWRFLSTCGMEVEGMRRDQVTVLTGREVALQAYLQYLRLLFNQSTTRSTRDHFNQDALQRIVGVSQSNNLTDRLLSTSLLRSISFPVDERRWWDDIHLAVDGETASLESWFRLFLIKVITDEMRSSAEKVVAGISLICGLMESVNIDMEYSSAFLDALTLHVDDSTVPGEPNGLNGRQSLTARLERCLNSMETSPQSWTKLTTPSQPHLSHIRTLQMLEQCVILLLRILYWLAKGPEGNMQDVFGNCKSFIRWAMTHESFSMQTRKQGVMVLEQCLSHTAFTDYIHGWEEVILSSCCEVLSHNGTNPADKPTSVAAASTAIHTLWHARPNVRQLLLMKLSKPEAIVALCSILDQDIDLQFSAVTMGIMQEGFFTVVGSYFMTWRLYLSVRPNNPANSAESAAVYAILQALINSGLKSIILKRISREGKSITNTSLLVQMIASFPSLAHHLISDHGFTTELISTARIAHSAVRRDSMVMAAMVLIQLSYRVRDLKSDVELQNEWLKYLVEVDLLRNMAEIFRTWSTSLPQDAAGLLWNSRCFLPILQDLLQQHRSVVLESRLIDLMVTVLTPLAERGDVLHPLASEVIIKASEVLGELRELIRKPETGEERKQNPPDDASSLQ